MILYLSFLFSFTTSHNCTEISCNIIVQLPCCASSKMHVIKDYMSVISGGSLPISFIFGPLKTHPYHKSNPSILVRIHL